MSDDDNTAKDKANNEATSAEQADAAQEGTAADATVKFESDSSDDAAGKAADSDAADTVKADDAGKTEKAGKAEKADKAEIGAAGGSAKATDADADATVKLPTAPPPASGSASTAAAASYPSPPPSGKKTPWVPIISAFAAGVVLVAAITAVAAFWMKADDRQGQLDARDDSTRAACDFGKAVASYDAKDLGAYFKAVDEKSTGEWGKFFTDAQETLQQAMEKVQAKSKLDEIHCAWESGNDTEANVVLVITQEQTNQVVPQPSTMTIPGVAHMEKHDGQWLVAKFDSPVTKGMGGPAAAAPGAAQPGPATPQADGGQPAPAPGPGN